MRGTIKTRDYFYTSVAQQFQGRGTVVQYPPSAIDPMDGGGLFAICNRHNKSMRIDDATFDLTFALKTAFDACPGCLDEVEAKTSRWPEGAEL